MSKTYSPDESNITQTALNLLEFTLASYEHLCMLKSTTKRELDRHERAIESAFTRSAHVFKDYLPWVKAHLGVMNAPKAPRVAILLRYCELGDDPTNACHRHFLVTRHDKTDAHRE